MLSRYPCFVHESPKARTRISVAKARARILKLVQALIGQHHLLFRAQLAALVIALSASVPFAVAEQAPETSSSRQPTSTLVTSLGDRLPGHWIATNDLETIEWQVEGFVQPFQFRKEHLSAIQIRHKTKVPQIEGTYRCELTGGDVLFGTPLAIDRAEFVFEFAGSAPLRIERNRLRKLSPWSDTGQSVSATPTALGQWYGSRSAWQEAADRIAAEQDNVELTSTLPLGDHSQISIRIAWEQQPDFRIDFGSSANWDLGLRLETWQKELVLVAESPQAADVLLVTDSLSQVGELVLNVFVDTPKQTILVATENGESLGKLTWPGRFKNNFRVQARKKGLHFYSATVTPWDGSSPELLKSVQPSVRTKDGKTQHATVTAWNRESQEWTVVSQGDSPAAEPVDRHVSSDELESLLLAGDALVGDPESGNPGADDSGAGDSGAGDPGAGDPGHGQPLPGHFNRQQDSVQVVTRTGMRITGEIVKLSDQAVELRCRGVKDPIVISLNNVRNLVFLKPPDWEEPKRPAKSPRLRIGDASIVGQLVNGRDDDRATALVWKPSASSTAAAIAQNASGSITYRDPPPPVKKPKAPEVARDTGIVGGIVRLFANSNSGSQRNKSSSKSSPSPTLHLRSGDSIPCQPKRIDSDGLTFASSVTEATFAPQETIKALVLVGSFQPARVTEKQRDRLLTLPRIQQEYPPRHLLLSVDGDLLRTRVIAMDDKLITAEIRLNQVKLPRKRVAAIAWLHQDKLPQEAEAGVESPASSSGPPLHVQAVQSDGIRLTFRPQEFTGGSLLGKSNVLGNCGVEVSQVDKFLFGQAIKDALQHQSHHLLTLRPAEVPRFMTAESSAPNDVGQDSALVDMEAPPIELKDLDGAKFNLTDHRGKVVVLDFWATWCGPCIEWMPQLEAIVANYSDEEVELVTINLMQEKEVIGPALERIQMSPTVLLDLDGVVADAYQAAAIPQTVIIDQKGKIAHLFIGGSPQIKQPLVEALDALTSGPATN